MKLQVHRALDAQKSGLLKRRVRALGRSEEQSSADKCEGKGHQKRFRNKPEQIAPSPFKHVQLDEGDVK